MTMNKTLSLLLIGLALPALAALAADAPAVQASQTPRPFADVPKDHWAYDAIRTAEKHGLWSDAEGRPLPTEGIATRYEVARALSTMLEKARMTTPDGRTFTAQDLANLESLAKEFSGEMRLIGERFDRVQANLNELRQEVSELRHRARHHGQRHRYDQPSVVWPPGR